MLSWLPPIRQQQPVPSLDLITVGRVNLDLYAQETGVEFVEVRGWDAMVGGSPTNVAIAASRLGLRCAVFTAVGADLIGDWVRASLNREGVNTAFVARKEGPHTSFALRAQLPPDHPLAFFRHDPADIHLTVADAAGVPVIEARALLISADALARGSTPEACRAILVAARIARVPIFLDLDLREVNWQDLDAYATTVALIVGEADVVLGTEEEFATLLGVNPDVIQNTPDTVRERLTDRPNHVQIIKQGPRGATALVGGEALRLRGFTVREASSIGAGDSFAAGLIHALFSGLDWDAAGEFASACAAITVSRFGCSSGFPTSDEVEGFLTEHSIPLSNPR
jgi:5-dehydro-2-deoxygluconokinase